MLLPDEDLPTEDISVYRADKYELSWKPRMQTFRSSEELNGFVASKAVVEQPGLSAQFNPLFHHNIGHALFDGLYPAYMALTKLGLQDEKFRPVVGVSPDCFDPAGASPELGLRAGDVLEAYLPHRHYNRSLQTSRVEVLSVIEKDNHETKDKSLDSACTFEAGFDSNAMQLDSKPVSPGKRGQAECCEACGKTIGCTRAVVFANVCYIKGSCEDHLGMRLLANCDVPKEERLLCRFDESRRPQVDLSVRQMDGSVAGVPAVEATIPLAWVVGKPRARCMSEGIYETFGKSGSMLRMFEMDRDIIANSDVLFHFDAIAFGSGSGGNLVADITGAIGRSAVPVNTMARFRDRMLEAYELPVGKKQKTAHPDKPLDVIVVANKRFSSADSAALGRAMDSANRDGKVKVELIDWPRIGSVDNRFREHLKRVQRADVYVSSIGTALQYVPFMRDNKVYIALGTLWQKNGQVFPTFMEQQLAGGGTPYLRTLYADPGATVRSGSNVMLDEGGYRANVNATTVLGLLQQAGSLVREGFPLPVPIEHNLSQEGRLLLELCKQDPATCKLMQADRNGADYDCAVVLWPECVVYEVGPWANKCNLNRGLLRKLRKEYGLFSYGATM
jgi:hypothetical protein